MLLAMDKRATWSAVGILTVGVLAGLAGCVPPGRIDPTVVNRYQKSLANHSLRVRGTTDLQPYEPSPAIAPAELTVDRPAGERPQVKLALDGAILRALANSVDIQIASYDPAVAREQMVQAAAAFDYVLAGSYSVEDQDFMVNSNFGGGKTNQRDWQAQVKQHTITGADASLGYSMTRVWNDQSRLTRPFPTTLENKLTAQILQPLLRDAWPEVNLARLRIARISRNISAEAFRQKAEETITEVISTYWLLIQARQEVAIQDSLLTNTIKTRDRIFERLRVDATQVELKQSESAVAIRKAGLIQARKQVFDVQDRLTRLLADPQLNILGDYEIIPTTPPDTAQVALDTADQLLTALQHNPVLEQARLAIAAADINVRVAVNQMLPKLNLTAGATYQGLGASAHAASGEAWTLDHFGYNVALLLEYPIGNRERTAQWRQRKYERLKAVASMQNTADQVAVLVNERIRAIRTSYEEVQAQHTAVEAAKVQLDALEATEEIRGRLSPAFLQTKLSAQETLAQAQRGELQAIINYNTSMAELARATGTVLEMHGVKLAMPVMLGEEPWPAETSAAPPAEPVLSGASVQTQSAPAAPNPLPATEQAADPEPQQPAPAPAIPGQ